ncbi:MAG: hypothetical protein HFH86_04485 [Bacilli bacterium]|jgi:hypothetical protein|nr:hypothetical protein [Bacilli bacterium]
MTKKRWIILGIVLTFFLVIGVSYAYWYFTKEQSGFSNVTSGCIDVEIISNSKEIKLENAYPLLNSEGVKLTPYTFTITNTCSLFVSYDITLSMLSTSTLESQYIAAVLDRNPVQKLNEYEEVEPLNGFQESRVLQRGSLSPEDSEIFNLRVWMDESVESMEAMNKLFQAKVSVTVVPSTYSPVDLGFQTLAEAMLVNEYQSSSVEQAKNLIKNKQVPDFSKTAPLIDWQENHEMNTLTTRPVLPHPDKVGQYQGFTNIEQSYLRLSNGYTFDSETGKYTLTDSFLIDPTTITDYDTKDYYYCGAGVNISASDVMSPYRNYENCTEIYKIGSATKEDSIQTGSSGNTFQMIQYNLSGNRYNQKELESDKSDKGLYMTLDDNGESYYYRGSVNNNYVKFAGFYWRIIRLNGDGSVRLLYAGNTPTANGIELSLDKKNSVYNSQSNLPGYVGYMYGNNLDTYENASKNEKDSTIKTVLDNWYQKNILEKGYHDKVADSIFCNDRGLQSGDGMSTTQNTYYMPHQRLRVDQEPTLMCHQEGDRFTVSEEKGNGALTYPIGLITSDELQYAGMAEGYLNKLSYAHSSLTYWTMSPSWFLTTSGTSRVMKESRLGYVHYSDNVLTAAGVRAVINLNQNTIITGGTGTVSNPFVVTS